METIRKQRETLGKHRVAHSASVRLFWWIGYCGLNRALHRRDGVHWDSEIPTCSEVFFECVGAVNRAGTLFQVHGVVPSVQMPNLNPDEKTVFISILKDKLESQTQLKVVGLFKDIVDWEGIPTI